MDDEKFRANVEVQQTEDGLWQPVLVVGKGEGEEAEEVRVAMTGAYPRSEQAKEAAKNAIAAMAPD
ncbi:hypothetical protein ACTJKJ_18540 [Roseateles sp. 22389]|uniref:hypothetical protein n=1 Tax=Roseateles sp. 22389 TaxID=3453916 RepID=UPI003F86A062